MGAPFLVRVSGDAPHASAIADAIRAGIRLGGAQAHVECAPDDGRGVRVSPGVWSEAGSPRWLEPIAVPDDPHAAASTVVDFLERWGFMARAPKAEV